MEIIRRATIEEMMVLDGIILEAQDLMTTIVKVTTLLFLIALVTSLALESTSLFFGSMTFILLSSLSISNYVETHIIPDEKATFNDHSYYLAIIDNSNDFEHESYQLVDHHKDNTYFVEDVRDSEEN